MRLARSISELRALRAGLPDAAAGADHEDRAALQLEQVSVVHARKRIHRPGAARVGG